MDGLTKSPLIEPRAHVIQEAMKIPFYDELHWIVFFVFTSQVARFQQRKHLLFLTVELTMKLPSLSPSLWACFHLLSPISMVSRKVKNLIYKFTTSVRDGAQRLMHKVRD